MVPNPREDGVRVVLEASDLAALEDWDLEYRAHREHDAMIEAAARFIGREEAVALDQRLHEQDPRYTGRHDLYWAAANHALLDAIRNGDWGGLAGLYGVMARQAYDEEDERQESGRVLALKREASAATLRGWAGPGVTEVRIVGCACSVCSRDQGSIRSIARELEAPSIPHGGCRDGYCSCGYAPADS